MKSLEDGGFAVFGNKTGVYYNAQKMQNSGGATRWDCAQRGKAEALPYV